MSFKKLVEDMASQLGYTEVNHLGSGHLEAIHPNGAKVRLPFTPKNEWRGKRNARAALERAAGRKLPRANSGKKRKGSRRQQGLTSTPPTIQSPRSVEREKILNGVASIDHQIRDAVSNDDYPKAKWLLCQRSYQVENAADKGIRVKEFRL